MTTTSKAHKKQQREAVDPERPDSGGFISKPSEYAWEALGLAEFPIVTTAAKRPPIDTLDFKETTTRKGKTIERSWAMVASSEYGLPRLYDLDLYVAINVLAERAGYESRLVKTTLHELCTIPGLAPGGTTYARIKAGTRRFIHTGYSARSVFWPDGAEQPIELEEWHILAEARLLPAYQDPAIRDGLPPSYILFGQKFLNILKREKRKTIDLALWRQLGGGMSKPLFHYLDMGIYDRDRFEIGIYRLGNHIGQTTRYAPSHAIRKLKPHLERFVELGFLHSFRFEQARSKADPMKLIVFPGEKARRTRGTPVQVPTDQESPKRPREGTTARNSGPSDPGAHDLCRYFADVRHGVKKDTFSRGELEAAREILRLADGDLDQARYVVDYALKAAAETEFNLQHLKGVLLNSYPERALAASQAEQDRKATAEKAKAAEAALAKERDAIREKARAEFDALPADKRDELVAEQKTNLAPFILRSPEAWPEKRIEEATAHHYVSEAVEAWVKERFRAQNNSN